MTAKNILYANTGEINMNDKRTYYQNSLLVFKPKPQQQTNKPLQPIDAPVTKQFLSKPR